MHWVPFACPLSQGFLPHSSAVPHFPKMSSFCCCYTCRSPCCCHFTPFQIHLQAGFPKPIPTHLENASKFLLGHLPCFHILYTSFLYSFFFQELLVHHRSSCYLCITSCLKGWASLELGAGHSWKLTDFYDLLLLSRTIFHGILSSSSLNSPKSVLWKSRVVTLLFAWFPPSRVLNSTTHGHHRHAFSSLHIPISPSLFVNPEIFLHKSTTNKINPLRMEIISWVWRDSNSVWVWHKESAMQADLCNTHKPGRILI